MRSALKRTHVSGAETLCTEEEISTVALSFIERALGHPKATPSEIFLTIERLRGKPSLVPVLPVKTLECPSTNLAKKIISELLSRVGISKRAINKALRIVYSKATMRGASLMDALTGKRLEPDKDRGIRVTRLGIDPASVKDLSDMLSAMGLNTLRIREALVLASKVASCPGIVAELCISDDPDYTTGYVASRHLGYQRIPNIKTKGSLSGGRVFFVRAGADVERIINYLEKRPVLVSLK